MPSSTQRACPVCHRGIVLARNVEAPPDRPVAIVTLGCWSCHHEWQVERNLVPVAPPEQKPTP